VLNARQVNAKIKTQVSRRKEGKELNCHVVHHINRYKYPYLGKPTTIDIDICAYNITCRVKNRTGRRIYTTKLSVDGVNAVIVPPVSQGSSEYTINQ
jgi:hypothetical protein